ncbi:metallophosphoesterase family protein [Persicobacter diffluens]|uniref:Alkaline phosphatase n=1 Tax=Persicobacter diffluens TaxID=981 RepID=A0AAN5AL96_9BACT|nr:alkaline phosphatase [Persicobacter diffluens]
MNRRLFIRRLSLLMALGFIEPNFLKAGKSKARGFRFGLLTDTHYADREAVGNRCYRASLQRMEDFVQSMNQEEVNFVMHLGDFKDEAPEPTVASTLNYLRTLEAAYGKFHGPRYHAVGNHDVDSISKAQFLAAVENTGIPKYKSYYSFDSGGWHFIVLDGNYDREGKDHHKGDFDWQDVNLPAPEFVWLMNDLKENHLPTIIFSHHLLHEVQHQYQYHLNNAAEVRHLLEKFGNVKAVFQGHLHQNVYQQINGIHYLTLPGMVDECGKEKTSYALVELTDDKIVIEGVGHQQARVLDIGI